MSVLDTIKGKIVNVQQDISDGFRSLAKVSTRSKSLDIETPSTESNSASVELLSRYQKIWSQLHQTSEILSQKAQFADVLVTNLFHQIDQQNAALKQFTAEMSGFVQLLSDVDTAKNKLVMLQGAFRELETLLVEFEDVIDETDQFKMREEHDAELRKYQQSKNKELEQVKADLASKHMEKVRRHEDQLKAALQERQKVFEEAFREQMIKYMTTGKVDCVPSSPVSDLAEIEIDQDREELDKFLGPSEDNGVVIDDKAESESDNDLEMETAKILEDEDCNRSESGVGETCDGDDSAVKNLSALIINESAEEKR